MKFDNIYLPSWVMPKPDAIALTPAKSSSASAPVGKGIVLIIAEKKAFLLIELSNVVCFIQIV